MTSPDRRVDVRHGEVAGGYGHPALLAMISGVIGLYSWLVGLIGPRYNGLGTDYMVYWSVG
jgi:hypothetical protein